MKKNHNFKKLIFIFTSQLFLMLSCTKEPQIMVAEEAAVYPCNKKVDGIIFGKFSIKEMTLITSNISLEGTKIVYGFNDINNVQVYTACNFPEELKTSLGKKVILSLKIFDIIKPDVREIPIEIIKYEEIK